MANKRVTTAKQQVKYALRHGVSIGGVKASQLGSELTRIYATHGAITTKTVVNEARPEDATLHPAFEWDDTVAGELYRENQARNIIRSVEIVKTDASGETKQVSAFVHLPSQTDEKSGTYEPVSVIVQQPDKFLVALTYAQSRVDSARAALSELKSAAEESDIPADRLATLSIAAMAMQTAHDAIARLQ